MWNRRRESKNTKLYEISSCTKLFIFLWVKGYSTWERERERDTHTHTQSFYADWFYIVSSQPNQRAAPVAHKVVWPRPALKVNLLLPRQELKSAFSQISAHASGAWRHSNPWSQFLSEIFLLTSLNDTSSPRARVNTCVNVAPN